MAGIIFAKTDIVNDAGFSARRRAGGRQEYLEPPLKRSGDADRYDHRLGNDDYTQAGNLYCLMC